MYDYVCMIMNVCVYERFGKYVRMWDDVSMYVCKITQVCTYVCKYYDASMYVCKTM